MKLKHSDFFWPGYTDLMISLFFVMFVLFVIVQINWNNLKDENPEALRETIERQKITIDSLKIVIDSLEKTQKATQKELDKIRNIQKAVRALPNNFFKYDSINSRFSLMQDIDFELESDRIKSNHWEYLKNAGKAIKNLIDTLKQNPDNKNVRYTIIVEGMASKDKIHGEWQENEEINYPLSYRRAWAVQKLWEENEIKFDSKVVDLQISGSGTGGIGRDKQNERKNQRILIHIIPKIEAGDMK